MEKWNDLAKKFFHMHEADLRPSFYRKWAGTSGRFQREIRKLERNFNRKCSNKNSVPRRSSGTHTIDRVSRRSANANHELLGELDEQRVRRSSGQLRVAHNPGHRMRHIIRNIEKWTEEYLKGCSNQHLATFRWQRFVTKWESEIAKNPIFQEEFEKEEKYLRKTRNQPGRPCGRIYREFGLHGQYMELRDASVDENNGYGDLGRTDFGNDHLMSMVPFEGKQKFNKSSITTT